MKTYWTLQETIARLEQPRVTGEVDVLFPWHGFSWAATTVAGAALLKVFTRASAGATPETLVDCYPRGIDLVATYAQTPERTVRPQVYWRYIEEGAAAGLELILSTQTSLLDSEPTTSLESTLPSGEVLTFDNRGAACPVTLDQWQTGDAAPRAVLFRPAQIGASYVEMVHPTDFAGVQLSLVSELPTVRWQLFPERLEKGVIRRGRIRGLVLPREGDEDLARQQLQAFAASPLVLST